MFKKKPTIKFASPSPFLELPSPSKKHIPEWYKKTPRYKDGAKSPELYRNGNSNIGLKSCVPFLDVLASGYTATLWQDVQVKRLNDGRVDVVWPNQPDVLSGRSSDGLHLFPVPHGHDDTQYVWHVPFIIKTPPGYSVLITHPFNRFDLPFTTLSGLVDSDSTITTGHLPFYMKKDFEGIIPAGTPIFQMIPFKRENWGSEVDPALVEEGARRSFESTRKIVGHYKSKLWVRKTYE